MSLSSASSLRDLAIAARLDIDPLGVQSALLAKLAIGNDDKEECDILYCAIAFDQLDYFSFDRALTCLRERNPARLEIRVLTLLGWLSRNNVPAIAAAPSEIWSGIEHSISLQLCKANYYIKIGNLLEAENILKLSSHCMCPEKAMLQASLLSKRGDYQSAIDLLLTNLHRCPRHLRYYRQLLSHMIDGKDGKNVMACAHEALSRFGEHPQILHQFTTLNLYKRQPGLAKRSALLQQLSASIRPTSINLGNQLATYEMNGQVDWLGFLSSRIPRECFLAEPILMANMVMQLASIQSEKYQSFLREYVIASENEPSFLELRKYPQDLLLGKHKEVSGLSVGWMTGDCTYHPVSRFLYGWFASCSVDFQHQHTLISLEDHREESHCDLFRSIPGLNVQDVSGSEGVDRLHEIRHKKYDVIVDLSGWTGGNFAAGLHARLAPLQVNYLGYFASSGLSSMDYWLGDSQLFPDDHAEWASESLYRLPRPFLAWTPQSPLPEADISVSPAPSGPIRFGSFNHNRKLSDATLMLWGQVLAAVPGSRLVLKASAGSDSDTQRLLRRRMVRQELDPERVEWLELTKGPVEHMEQYAQIDIALDPIPNGGCTTTCEALWMGVPTITLAGSHYVSRMSTAVLSGAKMSEWIAQDRAGYIKLACEHATRVSELRANRGVWRRKLQESPLVMLLI